MTMADDNQTQGNEQPGAPPQAKNSDTPGEPMIPKSRFDEVNTRLRQLEAQLKAAADQQAAAEAERLKEQGAWKDLAEKRAADLDAAQRELESLRLTMMRRDVAAKVGLPSALIDRLVGSTPEELEAKQKAEEEAAREALIQTKMRELAISELKKEGKLPQDYKMVKY